MLAEGLSLEECVKTIAATLPVCSVRGVAYSTFTIIHLKNNQTAELIQYDNPYTIIIRDDKNWEYPKTEMNIGGKKIYKSVINLQENDIFIKHHCVNTLTHSGDGVFENDPTVRKRAQLILENLHLRLPSVALLDRRLRRNIIGVDDAKYFAARLPQKLRNRRRIVGSQITHSGLPRFKK